MQPTELVRTVPVSVVSAEDFLPMLSVEQAINRKTQINEYIKGVMVEGEDYGYMPGDNRKEKKRVLLKPGAEKLCSIFGLSPRYVVETQIEDWTGKDHGNEPLFYYQYRCQLWRGDKFLGEGIGSANSWEQKHRYRWVKEVDVPSSYSQEDLDALPTRSSSFTEFQFAISKGETNGQYGKPAHYWAEWKQAIESGEAKPIKKTTSNGKELDAWERGGILYRVPNPDAADLVNTLQKMGQKRSQVAAVLVVTNCSDAFTQDFEEAPEHAAEGIDTGGHPVGTQAAADHVAQRKIQDLADPPELKVLLDGIDKDPRRAREAFNLLYKSISDKAGAAGAKAYEAIEQEFTVKYPKGTLDKNALKACVRDLWKALQSAEADKPDRFDEHMKAKEQEPTLFKDAPAFDPMSQPAEVKK